MTGFSCLICGRRGAINGVLTYWSLCPVCPDDHELCVGCATRWGLAYDFLWAVKNERMALRECPLPLLDEMRVASAVAGEDP